MDLVQEFWGHESLDSAKYILSKTRELGRFPHEIDGQPISAIFATGILDSFVKD